MAGRAFVQVALVDVAAGIADRVGDVEGEVVASLLGRDAEKLAVLAFAEALYNLSIISLVNLFPALI